ncbi:oligosaccharide flippase family protein [Paenibacillus daejeonensis]|uniref:oligosaccharide flippase family protein n=1 Tax=Paenibacillus daejeonensis TaxID=135193 RepID=UPI0003A27B84|nr:oligosaccharide flippase family protein [Paenibacillus daejeonensis]
MRLITNLRSQLLTFGGQKTTTFSAAAGKVFFSSVCLLILNMGTGILVARFLGPEGRGEQAAMILWPQFLTFLLTFGIPSSLVYFYKKNKAYSSEYLSVSIILAAIFGTVASLVGIFLIPYMLSEYSNSIILFAQLSMLLSPIIMISIYMSSALQAYDNYRMLNLSKTSGPFLTLLLIVGLIATDYINPYTTAIAYLIGSLPISVLVFFVLYKEIKLSFNRLKLRFKELFSYGIRAYAIDLLGTLSMQLDQILVVAMLTPTQMGYYTVALALAKLPKIVQTTIVTVLFPKAAGNDEATIFNMTMRSFRIGTFITGLLCIGALFLSPYAIELLYGREFMGAVATVQILLIREIIASGASILLQYFMANGKPGQVSILEAIGIGLNIPLMLWLLPLYGLPGVATALLLTSLVRLVFVIIFIRRSQPGRLQLILNKDDIKLMVHEGMKIKNKLEKRKRNQS